MDPTRNNPVIRFNTFWWALWTFLIFGVLLAAVIVFNRKPPTSLESAAAVARYATKDKVTEAQSAALSGAEIDAAIAKVAATLPSSKPAAVEKTEQVVPGSPTALKLAAEPASAPAANGAPAATPPAQPATPPAPPAKP
ncbi:MAG: hypothetical protein WCK77_01850 [Verrucomicrobiota bacterium]